MWNFRHGPDALKLEERVFIRLHGSQFREEPDVGVGQSQAVLRLPRSDLLDGYWFRMGDPVCIEYFQAALDPARLSDLAERDANVLEWGCESLH